MNRLEGAGRPGMRVQLGATRERTSCGLAGTERDREKPGRHEEREAERVKVFSHFLPLLRFAKDAASRRGKPAVSAPVKTTTIAFRIFARRQTVRYQGLRTRAHEPFSHMHMRGTSALQQRCGGAETSAAEDNCRMPPRSEISLCARARPDPLHMLHMLQ